MEQALLATACGFALAISHIIVFQRPKHIIVQTPRGVPNIKKTIPQNPCNKCCGTGKVTCGNCNGVGTFFLMVNHADGRHCPQTVFATTGRVNFQDRAVLPKGVYPEWCAYCRATGRWYCERYGGCGEHTILGSVKP